MEIKWIAKQIFVIGVILFIITLISLIFIIPLLIPRYRILLNKKIIIPKDFLWDTVVIIWMIVSIISAGAEIIWIIEPYDIILTILSILLSIIAIYAIFKKKLTIFKIKQS